MRIGDIEDKQVRERAVELASTSKAAKWRTGSGVEIQPDNAEDYYLTAAFDWGETTEGYTYWLAVQARREDEYETPKTQKMYPEEPAKDKSNENGHILPAHYDNEHGSLYKIAKQRGWDPYQFDAIKRIDRMYKKGELERDIEKTKTVLDMAKAKL